MVSAEAYAADLGRKLAADEAWERVADEASEDLECIRHEIEHSASQLDAPDAAMLRREARILREQAGELESLADRLEGK